MATEKDILDALKTCIEPELGRDIVSLNMVRDVKICGDKVSFDYILTTPACPLKGRMEEEAKAAVLKVPGIKTVTVNMSSSVSRDLRLEQALPSGIRNIVAVGSGKGGVGKSSVAANLAASLAMEGSTVGLMDADVYGPNQPQMFGVQSFELTADGENKITPPVSYGVKVMSMGFLMDPDTPVIWRGPMLHGAVTQFLNDVRWGELDYLIVDLPPGTGDVQLSLCQTVPLTGALIVTTPQTIALSDVRKAVGMFKKLNVPVLGVVENMSEFICPHCRKGSRIFSEGGGRTLSEKFLVPHLGSIPLDPAVCQSGETGKPVVLSYPDSAPAAALRHLARQVAAQVSLQNFNRKRLEIDLVSKAG